jgi:Zn-dependent protease
MRSYRVGRVMGIPIELNVTLIVFIPIIVWLIAGDVSSDRGARLWIDVIAAVSPHRLSPEPLQRGAVPWLLGTAAAVGLFASVAVHELGHSWVALRNDLAISSITLWIFGGMAQMDEEPEDWRVEFWMALAGPATSVGIGLGVLLLLRVVPSSPAPLVFVLGWLAVMNLVLAAFNLLPAFPMDGGRVLRALLSRRRSHAAATRTAAAVGKAVAVGMGILGILGFNPILLLIALFVYVGASGESRMSAIGEALEDVEVRDLMTREVRTVRPETTVEELTQRMLAERHTGYPVTDEDGSVVGIVTLGDVEDVRETERSSTTIASLMTEDVLTVEPDVAAADVLRTMASNGVGRLVVEERGSMVGIISRTDVMTAVDVLGETGGVARGALPGR